MSDNGGGLHTTDTIGLMIMAAVIAMIVTMLLVESYGREQWEKQAVTHHAGHYDEQTGAFKWNEKP